MTAPNELTMIEALNRALREALEGDDRVLILGEDVGRDGGIFRVTKGLVEAFGEQRVVDTPVAEAAIIGTALGLAMAGMRPVAEMQFSGFSYTALYHLENHVGRMRWRTRGRFTAPLVMRMPYGAGVRALEHHSESREVYFAHTPGLKTVIPRSPQKAYELLKASIQDEDPVVFMEPKALYRKFREEVPPLDRAPELGRTEVVQEGERVTLVAWGHMFWRVQEAAKKIEEDLGFSPELIDPQTIAPLDSDPIVASVKRTGRLVVVHEAARSFGAAGEIFARVNEEAFWWLEAPMTRVTGYDTHPPLLAREQAYMPTLGRILNGVRRVLEEGPPDDQGPAPRRVEEAAGARTG